MLILNKLEKLDCKTVITIGNFDGVHIGHRKLIEKTKIMAKKLNAKSLVFSFCPHTLQILKDTSFKTIYTNDERRLILSGLNIDYLLEMPFDFNIAKMKTDEFLNLIIENLNCIALVIGNNYKFGCDNSNFAMQKYKNKIVIENVESVTFDNEKLSSSYIRKLVKEKKIEQLEKLLGAKYFIMEKILHGQKRCVAFPTINFITDKNKLLPGDGVYYTTTLINNYKYKSLTNIGYNPTVENEFRSVETHILDFSKDVYGQNAIVYFNEFIRGEIKFDSTEKLKAQIQKDIFYVQSK
jgi:riboflavin kinase/FMN adenylyltransferase